MTTAASAQAGNSRSWARTVLLAAGFVLLAASTAQPAGAEEAQDPAAAATAQAEACEAAGGKATVEVERTVEGASFTSVTCTGGILDGVWCDNGYYGTLCGHPDLPMVNPGAGSQWSVYKVVDVLESGSVTRINAVAADLEAASASGQGAAADDDRVHDKDANTDKGKHGKHGKHGGNHRKR